MRLRAYRGETDEEKLRALHRTQAERSGAKFDFPDLTRPQYRVLCIVEDEQGQVRGALIGHTTIELMIVADDARVLRLLAVRRPAIAALLRHFDFDDAHAFVLWPLARKLKRLFERAGMRRSNPDYVPFYSDLSTELEQKETKDGKG